MGLILVEQCQSVVVVCAYILYQKKNSKPSILEGGTLVVSTREEEDEVIRVAFDILDRDHDRNLVRRLENVMR